jgi:SAM-dependent methyltransferase
VVGLDAKEEALRVAQSVLQRKGLDKVTLVHGDINELDRATSCSMARFDAAYCRLLLINQENPVHTLRAIANLVRPGGHIIAHELLFGPSYPFFDPPVPAFNRVMDLLETGLRYRGKQADVARRFHALAGDAGLTEVSQQGFFNAMVHDAPAFIQSDGIGILLSIGDTLIRAGLATETELASLAKELQDATQETYGTFFSWAFVELIAQVPC